MLGLIVAAIPALYFLVVRIPYRLDRFLAYLDPERDPYGIGYQIRQSLIAVGSGGWSGLGYAEGKQKLLDQKGALLKLLSGKLMVLAIVIIAFIIIVTVVGVVNIIVIIIVILPIIYTVCTHNCPQWPICNPLTLQ